MCVSGVAMTTHPGTAQILVINKAQGKALGLGWGWGWGVWMDEEEAGEGEKIDWEPS